MEKKTAIGCLGRSGVTVGNVNAVPIKIQTEMKRVIHDCTSDDSGDRLNIQNVLDVLNALLLPIQPETQ